ncbi:hypothetical protein [Amycolatopsis sp. NPDC054798]
MADITADLVIDPAIDSAAASWTPKAWNQRGGGPGRRDRPRL